MLHVVLHWTSGMDFGVRLCSFARVVVSIVVVWLFTGRERERETLSNNFAYIYYYVLLFYESTTLIK